MAQILKIRVTDGIDIRTRRLKEGTTIERGMEILRNLFEDDYLGLSYTLLVDGAEYATLEY